MIENPYPEKWEELQNGVCRILNEIGLNAEVGRKISTPRGTVEIDVYAVDEKSIDKIRYLVECKNWLTAIPQSVVHGFTTVMHEAGGNIGYIISQKGLQTGALEYTKNTNIIGLTYEEFQRRYFPVWYMTSFVRQIGDACDALTRYTEPISSRRGEHLIRLSAKEQAEFVALFHHYRDFGFTVLCYQLPRYLSKSRLIIPDDIEEVKGKFARLGDEFKFTSRYFRDLLEEIKQKVNGITAKFNDVFGKDIFAS